MRREEGWGRERSGTQKRVDQSRPDKIFPTVNFAFSRDGHFGLGGGGGGEGGGRGGSSYGCQPSWYTVGETHAKNNIAIQAGASVSAGGGGVACTTGLMPLNTGGGVRTPTP